MRRRTPRPIAAALAGVAEAAQPQTMLAAVQRAWPQAVGEAIAREAEPVAERDGVVTVACSSATWAAELDLMQSRLRARLGEALGDEVVSGMRFVAGGLRDSQSRT
jgi:predicted nucleic acid-binding Zn ribbon protein